MVFVCVVVGVGVLGGCGLVLGLLGCLCCIKGNVCFVDLGFCGVLFGGCFVGCFELNGGFCLCFWWFVLWWFVLFGLGDLVLFGWVWIDVLLVFFGGFGFWVIWVGWFIVGLFWGGFGCCLFGGLCFYWDLSFGFELFVWLLLSVFGILVFLTF